MLTRFVCMLLVLLERIGSSRLAWLDVVVCAATCRRADRCARLPPAGAVLPGPRRQRPGAGRPRVAGRFPVATPDQGPHRGVGRGAPTFA